MQQVTDYPRDGLTTEQVRWLIEDAPSVQMRGGLELLDQSLGVLEDLSDDLAGGSVTRGSYNELHGQATVRITRRLSWGSAIVRPYLVMTAGDVSARFNLGAYYTSTPRTDFQETPATYEVTGYDILFRLSQKVGDAYAVAAGVNYLVAVEDVLVNCGYTAYILDQTRSDAVLASAKTWALDPQVTWLTVVNDLLGAIGYQGIWSDWDGRLRAEPYTRPVERAYEWIYSAESGSTILGTERSVEYDYFDAPNRWVVWKSNDTDGPPPVEGNGLYTYTNESNGDTSVEARGGLVITRMEQVDAADQDSLVARAQQMIDSDTTVPTRIPLKTFPNPLHWHFDHVFLDDPVMGPPMDVLCTSWTLPLPPDTGDMSQEWQVLV